MKNKYVYFTSAMDEESFKDYLKDWKVSPNLSNQNFHNKLIHSLALSHDIDVISVRSINKNFKHKTLEAKIVKEDNIFWKYTYVSANRIKKYLKLFKWIKQISMQDSEIVFVDVLNLSLLKNAVKYARKYKKQIIGVVTDSPNNISFLKKRYRKALLKYGQSLDGYIVLTDRLGDLYNINNKPITKIDGVSEFRKEYLPQEIEGKYIYFGGSLMPEYGVYNLIEAFKKINDPALKLVLCGHHVDMKQLHKAIKDNPNIIYKGPVAYEENLSLEKHSVLAINPRPINDKIDEYSIPSKTIEFLANGILTVTVNNLLLKDHYGPCIVWAETGEVDDLVDAINKALSMTKIEKEMITLLGKNKAMQYTSQENINKQIDTELLGKISLN